MSKAVRKLDPPNAPMDEVMYERNGQRHYAKYPSLSDRYVKFYSRIAELTAKVYPDKWLGAYAYSNYRTPPIYAEVADHILIGFVGLNYLNDAGLARDRRSWEGWAQSAEQILLRPNLFYTGHGFPVAYPYRLGRDIKRCYQTGMVATDFGSCLHHWATQGLNYYVLSKLLWDPSQSVETIVQDYCKKGFGRASAQIRNYYDQLAVITRDVAAKVGQAWLAEHAGGQREVEKDWLPRRGGAIASVYTPEVIAQLRGILERARKAAGDDRTIQNRIDFLEVGLDYASSQARLYKAAAADNQERGKRLMKERYDLFGKILKQHPHAVNVAYILSREGGWLAGKFDWQPPETN